MSSSLDSLERGYVGIFEGTVLGLCEGDTRSIDYSSDKRR